MAELDELADENDPENRSQNNIFLQYYNNYLSFNGLEYARTFSSLLMSFTDGIRVLPKK